MKNTRIEKGITQKNNHFQVMIEKVIATIVIYLIFSNTMLPTMLSKVYADEAVTIEPNKEGKYAILEVNYNENDEDQKADWEDDRIAEIDLKLVGDIPVSGAQFEFNYDSSILTPYILKNIGTRRNPNYVYVEADSGSTWSEFKVETNGGSKEKKLDKTNCTIHYLVSIRSTNGKYSSPYEKTEMPFAKMLFKVAKGYDIQKLPKSAITLKPQEGLPTGYKISYATTSENDNLSVNDTQYFGYKGFDANSKVVKKANVEKYPNKTTYTSGDKIDLTGGTLKVTYDNDTTGSVSMTDKDVTLVNDTADLNNPTLILKYKGLAVEEDIPITVKDVVTSIQIVNTPTKLEYKQGEAIDYAGGMIQVNYKSGDKKTISTDDDLIIKNETIADLTKGDVTILGQSKDGLDFGSKTLTIEYEGQKATFEILINDSIDKIEAKDYKVNYKIGDTEIDRTKGKVVATTKSGAEYEIPFANETLEFKNFKSYEEMHDRPITVSYMGMSTTFNINVLDYETGITINTMPTKIKYECGDDLDLTGGIINILKASGNTETIPMTDSRVKVIGFKTNESGNQTLTANYNGFIAKFDVNVIDKLDEIEIDETPKTEYCIGDSLDLTKGTITAKYLSKKAKSISLSDTSINGVDTSKLGKQTATVTYTEEDVTKTTTYDVNVVDKVKTMTITKQPKTQFNFGDDIENIGGELYVEYEASEPSTIPITADMITEEDGTPFITRVKFENGKTSLTKNAKINYRNESITIPVTIKNNPVSIKVTKNPDKTKYYYGDNELDLTGGELTITRANEKEEVLKLTDPKITVTGFNSSKANDDLKLKVTYKEENDTLTTDLDLSVEDTLQKIELVATPKKEYYYGDKVENAKVNVTRLSGTKIQEITPTGFDSTKLGKQTLTVTVEDKKITYDVTVLDKATITLVEPTKLSYYKGEKLDLTNGKIVEHYLSGKDKYIPLTSDMIICFDSNKLGKQTLKVKYNETEFTFNVEVQEKKTELKPTKKVTKDNTKETPTNTVTTVTSVKSEKPKASTTIKKTKSIKTSSAVEATKKTNETTIEPTEETTNEEQQKTEMKPAQEETEKENKNKGNTIVGSVNDNNSNKPDQTQKDGIKNTIFGIIALFALFVLYAIDKNKNVRIYVESGDDRILVGREKITKEDRKLDLGKYYERYGEETFDIVLDKDISEKLDKKQVNVTVNNSKKEKFEVNYNNEEYTYKTKA